jgi:hypothetical protein
MVKYLAVAFALKMFSLSPGTKKLYRFLGNTVGQERRVQAGLPASYVDRARWIVSLFGKYNLAREGARFLELGTGWVHWESTVLRLFYDAEATLFDVWDNRQLEALKAYFSEFRDVFDNEFKNLSIKPEQARDLLNVIISVESFTELYNLLGFQYVVEPTGSLHNLERQAYDACFSYNVFEHIDRAIVSDYIKDLFMLLKPGGYSFMHIDIRDHLAYYDRKVSGKNYLKYSDQAWERFFANDVQYFNRIQRQEWLTLFRQAGFEIVEEESQFLPVQVKINEQYQTLDRQDLECTGMDLVHRRPLEHRVNQSMV